VNLRTRANHASYSEDYSLLIPETDALVAFRRYGQVNVDR